MNGLKQRPQKKWCNKPKPNTLRNLIRFIKKWAAREPENWTQIASFALLTAKSNWNISDNETINKLVGSVYVTAKDVLAGRGKTPEDFIPEMKLETKGFHPVKIEGQNIPVQPIDKNELAT